METGGKVASGIHQSIFDVTLWGRIRFTFGFGRDLAGELSGRSIQV